MEKNKDNSYKSIKNNIDIDYTIKTSEQNIFLKNHWRGFNEKVEYLESIVKKDFVEAIKDVNLEGAEILGYDIKYNPEFKSLDIKITKWKSSDGRISDDNSMDSHSLCPHFDLAHILGGIDIPVHPKIIEFKKKYDISRIKSPKNYCNHK
jgi:uncharacterized protein (UPF0335 family)